MDDESMETKKLDNESLNDYNIYKDISNIFENEGLFNFKYKDGKIFYFCQMFEYLLNNGQQKYFYNNSKIIYFTNKNEDIFRKPFFIHDETSLDEALKKTKIKNGILKHDKIENLKNQEKNDNNKPSDSPDSTKSKSSIYSVNNYDIEYILNSNFNLIKEENGMSVKLILNEKRFNNRFAKNLILDLDFNFKYIKEDYIKNNIDYFNSLNNYLNELKTLVSENNTKSYCYIFGPRGIGKTTMLLIYLNFFRIPRLYFSLKIMSKIDFKNRRLKKYALMETIYIFDDLEQMNKFSEIKIDEIPDSSNLLEFILNYIQKIMPFFLKEYTKRKKKFG